MQITTAVSKTNPLCVNSGKICIVLFNPDIGLPLTKKSSTSFLLIVSVMCVSFQIIFVTALFYLLSTSGEQYKPVEWFGKLTATGTSGFGDSAYGAIRFV